MRTHKQPQEPHHRHMQRRGPRGHRLAQHRGRRRQDLRRLLREAAREDGEEGAEDAEAGGEDGRVCLRGGQWVCGVL